MTRAQQQGRWFSLSLPDAQVRKLTRKQYYEMRSFLRHCERIVFEQLKGK